MIFRGSPTFTRRNLVTTIALLAFIFPGCGKKSNNEVQTECVVNPDQVKTFVGHWPHNPIPIAIEAVDFNQAEQDALLAAVATWNDFFGASKGIQIYFSGNGGITTQSGGARPTAATVCSQSAVGPSGFTKNILILKNTSWSYDASAIAVTSTCPTPASGSDPYKQIVAAVMEINYHDYFVAGRQVPDFQSILTHELGHLLGLGHACGRMSDGSQVDCANPDYQAAVMYPALGFAGMSGIQKRELQDNDEYRANCLY